MKTIKFICLIAGMCFASTVANAQNTADTAMANAPVLVYAEQMPQFPGDLLQYLSTHIKYPEEALHDRVEGKVTTQFVVNPDGSLRDLKVVRGIGHGCDEEALRVIKGMPRWRSGKQNGTPVPVRYYLPIIFKLES